MSQPAAKAAKGPPKVLPSCWDAEAGEERPLSLLLQVWAGRATEPPTLIPGTKGGQSEVNVSPNTKKAYVTSLGEAY